MFFYQIILDNNALVGVNQLMIEEHARIANLVYSNEVISIPICIRHVFISFAFDTFGFLAPEAVNLSKRVQKVMHSNVV
jgi:hypothetical protein